MTLQIAETRGFLFLHWSDPFNISVADKQYRLVVAMNVLLARLLAKLLARAGALNMAAMDTNLESLR